MRRTSTASSSQMRAIRSTCACKSGVRSTRRLPSRAPRCQSAVCRMRIFQNGMVVLHIEPLARPMTWKFNRKVLDSTNGAFLVTTYGVQDYRHAGATAFVLQSGAGSNPFGGVGIDMTYSPVNAALSDSIFASNSLTPA